MISSAFLALRASRSIVNPVVKLCGKSHSFSKCCLPAASIQWTPQQTRFYSQSAISQTDESISSRPVSTLPKATPRLTTGTVTLKHDWVYEGELRDGVPHGDGKLTYPQGQTWEGEFRNGKPFTGKGFRTVGANGTYQGEQVAGKRNGEGVMSIIGVPVWQGIYKEGREFTGSGFIQSPGNRAYTGELLQGKRHGQGKFTCGKSSWEGEFVKGFLYNGVSLTYDGAVDETVRTEWVRGVKVGGQADADLELVEGQSEAVAGPGESEDEHEEQGREKKQTAAQAAQKVAQSQPKKKSVFKKKINRWPKRA